MDSDTYRRVGNLSLSMDLTVPSTGAKAIVVWIHGGALINGYRDSVPGWLSDVCAESDFVLASIDYRLAPETKLPDIVGDVEDAFKWLRTVAPESFPVADRIAANR